MVIFFSPQPEHKAKSYFQGGLNFIPLNLHNPSCPPKSIHMPLGNKVKNIKQQAINTNN